MNGLFHANEIEKLVDSKNVNRLIKLLEALNLCTQLPREIAGIGGLEFPCFNYQGPPSNIWEKSSKFVLYGGIRLMTPRRDMNQQLIYVFPRIQVQLRRNFMTKLNNNSDNVTLEFWRYGTKLCSGKLECLITLEMNNQVIDIKLRGQEGCAALLYGLMEKVYDCVMIAVEDMCPSLISQRHLLSAFDLRAHATHARSLSPKDILATYLQGALSIVHEDDGEEETLLDLICFGSEEVRSLLIMGTDLHIMYLSPATRRQLCRLLDTTDETGRDWCMLAVKLGVNESLPDADTIKQEEHDNELSKTDHVLFMWARDSGATAGQLINKLRLLHRKDAADVVLSGLPISVVKLVSGTEGPSQAAVSLSKQLDIIPPIQSLSPATNFKNINEVRQSTKL